MTRELPADTPPAPVSLEKDSLLSACDVEGRALVALGLLPTPGAAPAVPPRVSMYSSESA